MTTARRSAGVACLLASCGLLGVFVLAGCASQPGQRAGRSHETVQPAANSSAAAPSAAVFAEAPTTNTTASITTTPEPVPTGTVMPSDSAIAAAPDEENIELAAIAEQSVPALVNKLASLLRDDVEKSATPMVELAQLASLDTMDPGTFERTFGTLDQPQVRQRLTPQEYSFLSAWRNLQTQTGTLFTESGDLSRLAQPVNQLSEAMRSWQSLTVPRAMLCTKVDGFGVYTEVRKFGDTYKMIAGRRQRVIVYCEIENFSHRAEVRDGVSGWNVELVQDLRLSLAGDAEDVLAWRKPDQRIVDFSANQRRDFFVVQIVELPETLSIGRYNLKVVVRDASADTTGGVPSGRIAQALIPIQIVADASALRD